MQLNALGISGVVLGTVACIAAIGLVADRMAYTPTDISFTNALSERVQAIENMRDPATLDDLSSRVDGISERLDELSRTRKELSQLQETVAQLRAEAIAATAGLAAAEAWMKDNAPSVVDAHTRELRKKLMELIDKRDELLRSEEMTRRQYEESIRAFNRDNVRGRGFRDMMTKGYEKAKQLVKDVEAEIIEVRLKLDDD